MVISPTWRYATDCEAAAGAFTTMDKRTGLIGGGSVVTAGLAVLASSCCGIPLALAMVGVSSGVIGILSPLQPLRIVFLVLSALLVAAGWFFAYRRRSSRAYLVLGIATLLLVVATLAPIWEPQLTHSLSELRR